MSESQQRHVLRPEHFIVAPQLLGLPLARPSRRLAAMLIDLLLVAILVRTASSILLAAAAAWAFFRFAGRTRVLAAAPGRTSRRIWLLRATAAFVLFLAVKDTWNKARSVGANLAGLGSTPTAQAKGGEPVRAAFDVATGMVALQNAADEAQAQRAAQNVVRGMRAAGAADGDIRETLQGAAEGDGKPWVEAAIESALPPAPEQPAPAPAESLAVWHAAALTRGDTAAADSLAPRLASALARDSLDHLRGEVGELQKERDELRRHAEEVENRGLLASILRTLDELGIGFGWTGLYFTALTALWKGQTLGKRLMGVRVVRLNGEPMTFWMSFERFGGYAAGLVTGLLGFAQIFWDRNRQAIHDKITETVVVREAPAPAPAPEPQPGERPRYRAPV